MGMGTVIPIGDRLYAHVNKVSGEGTVFQVVGAHYRTTDFTKHKAFNISAPNK